MPLLMLLWVCCTGLVIKYSADDLINEQPLHEKVIILFKHEKDNYYKYYEVKVYSHE